MNKTHFHGINLPLCFYLQHVNSGQKPPAIELLLLDGMDNYATDSLLLQRYFSFSVSKPVNYKASLLQ